LLRGLWGFRRAVNPEGGIFGVKYKKKVGGVKGGREDEPGPRYLFQPPFDRHFIKKKKLTKRPY